MRGSLATFLALAWLLGVGPLQGVYSQQYAPPTESECRPYIEKALKEQGPPDTPPASIDDTGSSEETAGPEVPLNEQTDPEATTADTAPESEEAHSVENVSEGISGEEGQEQGSLEEDGVESMEQETPSTEEQAETSASADAGSESTESTEQESPAAENASIESSDSIEQGGESVEQGGESIEQGGESVEQGGDSVEQGGESVEQGGDSIEQGGESVEQGEESVEQGGDSVEQGGESVEQVGDSIEQGSDSVEEGGESMEQDGESMEQGGESIEQDDAASVESTEQSEPAGVESMEQEETPVESAEDSAATEEASIESTEETQEATDSTESVEQGDAPATDESTESSEATDDASIESTENVEEPSASASEEQETPTESTEVDAASAESLEQDAAPAESSEEAIPTDSTESLEQEALPTETEPSAESLEETVGSESTEQESTEGSQEVEQTAPTESVESSEHLEEGTSTESSESAEEKTPTESAESLEQLEETMPAESTEEGSTESAETTEQTSESGEAPSEETASSEEQVGEPSQEEPSTESVEEVEETVLSRERRSLDEEVPASAEDTGSVETADSQESGEATTEPTRETSAEEPVGEPSTEESVEEPSTETEETTAVDEEQAELEQQTTTEAPSSGEAVPETMDEEEREVMPVEELSFDVEIPSNLRPRDHIAQILKLDETSVEDETVLHKVEEGTLKDLKRFYDNAIKPLEMLYKYRDLSNRHFGDPEIFSKPLILFMGPWSGGKSSIINYLLNNEYNRTSLRTGAEPSPAYFNLVMWGEREEVMDGTQLAADWTFSGLQKFGQGLLDRLRGLKLKNRLLEKVNIVEIPGILEIRKQVERLFPFNDACQWFIDRADIIFLVYDPSKLDVGPETEAILDQLKGREYQTRIVLNKADQVRPEELMRVQGTLIWNISPLMSSSQPPVMYSTSLWSMPYEAGAPLRLLRAQEGAFLRDMREAIDKRVENKIASARRFAVRVRNHAKMVDCYLTTYYNHKSFFGNRKKISDDIIERPQDYHIYEGLSTLTNISRYDLPDPETYRDFFKLNPLYDFQQLAATCTYFRGCPINRLDIAIAYDLPELVGKYKESAQIALEKRDPMKS